MSDYLFYLSAEFFTKAKEEVFHNFSSLIITQQVVNS